MNKLTLGKIRGLQQIATSGGVFIICALDHRGSLKTMLGKEWAHTVSYDEMVEYKMELCDAIMPFASGILLDPIYGAAQAISQGKISGKTGLLVSIEATGYQDTPEGRITTILDGWDVEKIKRMGASAVKMLVYYRPDLTKTAQKQQNTVKKIAADCIKFDIPFLVEPVSYPVEKQGTPEYFANKRTEIVLETARQMTKLPIDVLKVEFPTDINHMTDSNKLLELCQKLNEVMTVPWVILSGGVNYEVFRRQVEIACKAGASGFLGGRAIWQESAHIRDKQERAKYLKTTVADRLRELAEITVRYAFPWHRKMGLERHNLGDITENWYKNY